MKNICCMLGVLGLGGFLLWSFQRKSMVRFADASRMLTPDGNWSETINAYLFQLWHDAHPDAEIVNVMFDPKNTQMATIVYSEPVPDFAMNGLGDAWSAYNAAHATAAAAGGGGRSSSNPQQAVRDAYNNMQNVASQLRTATQSAAGDRAAAGIEFQHGQAANDPNRVGNRVKNAQGQWEGPPNSGNSGVLVTVDKTRDGLAPGGNAYNIVPESNLYHSQFAAPGAVTGQWNVGQSLNPFMRG